MKDIQLSVKLSDMRISIVLEITIIFFDFFRSMMLRNSFREERRIFCNPPFALLGLHPSFCVPRSALPAPCASVFAHLSALLALCPSLFAYPSAPRAPHPLLLCLCPLLCARCCTLFALRFLRCIPRSKPLALRPLLRAPRAIAPRSALLALRSLLYSSRAALLVLSP